MDQEVQQERFARAGRADDQRVCDVLMVQVEVIRGRLVGFEEGEIFAAEVPIRLLSCVNSEQKREVGVIRVEQVLSTQVERGVAGNGREECIQQVVAFV